MRTPRAPRRETLQKGIIILPSAFTLGNLFFGLYAMVAASRGDLVWAGWFIVFAGTLDMLDGSVARFTPHRVSFRRRARLSRRCDLVRGRARIRHLRNLLRRGSVGLDSVVRLRHGRRRTISPLQHRAGWRCETPLPRSPFACGSGNPRHVLPVQPNPVLRDVSERPSLGPDHGRGHGSARCAPGEPRAVRQGAEDRPPHRQGCAEHRPSC